MVGVFVTVATDLMPVEILRKGVIVDEVDGLDPVPKIPEEIDLI